MRSEEFEKWLINFKEYKTTVVKSRMANCRNVERYYQDLDRHFQNDGGRSLMDLLVYSTKDERSRKPAKHNIPIDGDIRTGSATLKQAVKLYMEFCGPQNELKSGTVCHNKKEVVKTNLMPLRSLNGFHRIIRNSEQNISYKNLFGEYLVGATEFIVRDPFIRHPYQLRNFMELCRLIATYKPENEVVRIHLITFNEEEFLRNTKQAFEEMIPFLLNQGLELSYEFSVIQHDRSIEMNNGWKILLGRGLDIWQRTNGYYDIAEFDQEKRLCKEFEITIVKN